MLLDVMLLIVIFDLWELVNRYYLLFILKMFVCLILFVIVLDVISGFIIFFSV